MRARRTHKSDAKIAHAAAIAPVARRSNLIMYSARAPKKRQLLIFLAASNRPNGRVAINIYIF